MIDINMVSTPLNVDEVFDALEVWIKQCPGLDGGGGRDGFAAYRSELRSISKDRQRAIKALDEARSLTPAQPDLLKDAFRAFSGRLEWIPPTPVWRENLGINQIRDGDKGRLEYTTGQYWPTEYRKAAASVLELYIASWYRWWSEQHPQTFTYRTIEDVKSANRQTGGHWFDTGSMRFFNTKIESGLIRGKYFVSSEKGPDEIRRYSVRMADPDGSVDTVGEFGGYRTRESAREAIKELVK